ncbi:glycine cleavage system aminomethyltransferase GcvT [Acetobacter tropicalis]|uniref:aminomethyltransferase n=1 Tax=Acetobacter tropicalis TaxID=104102 RepID=A0A094YL74_9PROT|nr:glycine cleavage system aminomethyltransferase GcvT [Acetobacter tropicalis]KAA8389073.1 glycine cleavage system aminomethyltransferase GcvT [Acetobacter tropicalis]KAA8391803.1 glycine cleavage system aminomethyltransferase GcvT [Acetobacter tropicalis]KGB22102.1 Aminomethyltransferase (glycine cleavage system T protein) [Acetobacter tropicalis]MBC9009076.1 glycine cleavage system aminomethyltransferase GcvT [Acetobacter tropicalis]MDO8171254.1 glycine cleavage system aminomethyltransferas
MSTDSLLHTPLFSLHEDQGGKMVPFAGYAMPLNYADGIMAEHRHVRTHAGLFDVSHMGQVKVRARSGSVEAAAKALERLVPADIVTIKNGRQRYTQFTNAQGGILDDLMVARLDDTLLLVVNAACKAADIALMQDELVDCLVEPLEERALLALQGPEAEQALASLAPDVKTMAFMDVRALDVDGASCVISRSGYTGEDGFEISVPALDASRVARQLLAQPNVKPIGLGARDSLRLEAGMCLYGADIDETTTPVEAALEWSIQKSRRKGGAREGGFPGADIILGQLENGVARRRVGLLAEGRAPVRGGAPLYSDPAFADGIGKVTSGAFGPTVEAPVAMGYVATAYAAPKSPVFAELRGRAVPAVVASLPFVPARFKR